VSARKIPIVAIVGRTNVGKSSLFNCLLGRRQAIVEDQPGVTRDRSYALCSRYDKPFTIIDTGGLFGDEKGFADAVRYQAQLAIDEADVILAVFDGLDGVHPHDEEVVSLLRQSDKPVIWVVNKCEKPNTEQQSADFYRLGVDNVVCVSAAHKVNIDALVEAIHEASPDVGSGKIESTPDEQIIRVAVLGRPNVGKSSLINRILGEERLVASPVAGTTRDSVDITLTRDGQKYRIVDTAGLRKKANVPGVSVERYGNLRSLKALADCDVAVLVLDTTEGAPMEQDAKVAGLIHERGRAFIIVANKWDIVEKDHTTVKQFETAIYNQFKFARYAPIIFTSAATGRRCPSVLEKAKEVYEQSQIRIPTSELNRVLEAAFRKKPPPVYRGQPVKLFFATQTDVAPPTIVLFVSFPQRLNYAYERYVRNCLREHFPFVGSDIRLIFRKRTEKASRDRVAVGAE
jgi:GTP-binding protein